MIVLKEFPGVGFPTKEEAFEHLVKHEKLLIAHKKSVVKHADEVSYTSVLLPKSENGADKAFVDTDADVINVKLALNTCNYFDSHKDVSIEKSWNRTAKNTTNGLHLQEHKMQFSNLISDNVKYSVERMSWKDLGLEAEGDTEVLMMHSTISKDENPYMFKKYMEGKVKNHSAGLRYVSIKLALNSDKEEHIPYKSVYDAHIGKVVNRAEVEEEGYFWAVTEQKIIEGSAVLKGSNPITPTISVESAQSTSAQSEDKASPKSTPKRINPNFY